MHRIFTFLIICLTSLVAQADEAVFWKCVQDDRDSGGIYKSVSLVPNGSLFKLAIDFQPEVGSNVAGIVDKELISDLHCRFYMGTPRLVQCVSTNFKRYIETILEEDPALVTLNIKSDFEDHSKLNLSKSEKSFCGFVE